jgi:hypothetical protein
MGNRTQRDNGRTWGMPVLLAGTSGSLAQRNARRLLPSCAAPPASAREPGCVGALFLKVSVLGTPAPFAGTQP